MIQDFPRNPLDNIGGMRFFRFAASDYVSSIPYPSGKIVTGPISFHLAYTWSVGYSPYDAIDYELESIPDSKAYKFSIEGFAPKIQELTSSLFDEMKDHRFILDTYDNNGNRKLIGSIDNPVGFRYKEVSSKPGGRNGYAFSFYGELTDIYNYVDATYGP